MQASEQRVFHDLQHWLPQRKILAKSFLVSELDPLFPLFSFLYDKTEKLYQQLPQRKNGEQPFIHPLNVVYFLKKAGVTSSITLCAGLVHDYIEEQVDLYRDNKAIPEDVNGKERLDRYEKVCHELFLEEMSVFCQKQKIPCSVADEILAITALLTRHKRDFYYQSIAHIFTEKNQGIQKQAIQIKLADRMHNVQCISSFKESGRLYSCYKTFFILNNTKQWLLQQESASFHTLSDPTAVLFNKCCKAMYDAYLVILQLCKKQGITEVLSLIHLAFRKYALEIQGMWEVTKADPEETHPFRLFQGIIRKYDARLCHQFETFTQIQELEMTYCHTFFAAMNFSGQQIQALLDYKDAYALKEAVAQLLYQEEYLLQGFLCDSLSGEGRI